MIRRPPKSTLFPDATPFRSAQPWSRLPTQAADRQSGPKWQPAALLSPGGPTPAQAADRQSRKTWQAAELLSPGGHSPTQAADGQSGSKWQPTPRSEEQTSELQSRQNFVCRLLFEKKQ